MKKLLRNFALAAVAVAGAVSCTQSEVNDDIKPTFDGVTLYATTPSNEASTKVDFTDEGTEGITLEWEAGDEFVLYNSDGEKIDTFITEAGDGKFTSTKKDLFLTDGDTYTAKFNDVPDTDEQNGDDIDELHNACKMKATFVYGKDVKLAFVHTKAIMTFKFKSSERPAKLVFDDGYNYSYTVLFSTITADETTSLYTSHIMVYPTEEGAGPEHLLKFSLYADGETEPYDVREVVSDIRFVAGVRYTSPLSDLDNIIWHGSGAVDDPYIIDNATKLRDLSKKINAGEYAYYDKYYKVVDDIDLKGAEFTPIGDINKKFRGSFDGAGYTISGLYVNNAKDLSQGLFGYTQHADIMNVNISGSVTGCNGVGGLVGYAEDTVITSCSSDVKVAGSCNVGGIVGFATGGNEMKIVSCYNLGSITTFDDEYRGDNAGGIVGAHYGGYSITSCYNMGDITSVGEDIGGIAGMSRVSIVGCYNSGEIKTTTSSDHAGGIVGCLGSSGDKKGLRIEACYNIGIVDSENNCNYSGSIFGYLNASSTLCHYNYFLEETCHNGASNFYNSSIKGAAQSMSEAELKDKRLLDLLNNASLAINDEFSDGPQLSAWVEGGDHYPTLDYKSSPEYTEIKSDLIYDKATNTYEIPTADALREFATKINTLDNTANAVVTADIDLKDEAFTTIGTSRIAFKGTFDGAGHTISGLYINTKSDYQGLFAHAVKATIKDLNISGSVTGGEYVGGLVGCVDDTSIISCNSSVAVTGATYVGGLVGYGDALIAYCHNSGVITVSQEYAGGIIGYYFSLASIISCYNTAVVTGDGEYVGGIAGKSSSSIIGCYNSADISCSGAEGYAGGIAGMMVANSGATTYVKASYTTGTVTAINRKWNSGSFFGATKGNVMTENVAALKNTCQNNNNNNESVGGDSNLGLKGIIQPMTEEELKSNKFLIVLNNAAYTYNKENSDATQLCAWESSDGYHVLNYDKKPEFTEIKNDLIYDEATNTYEISTVLALRSFAEIANTDDKTVNGVLTADINLENEEFTPIGNYNAKFEGSFDGAGHTISGLYINSEKDYQGLFGYVVSATIENLYVSGSVSGGQYVGGLVGWAYYSSITSCSSDVTVAGSISVGGIAGYSSDSTITSCHNLGDVTASGSDWAGGIVGASNSDKIKFCHNEGAITGKSYIGGIVGTTFIASDTYLMYCYNTGAVTGSSSDVGGIAGTCRTSNQETGFAACYNSGVITGYSVTGGLIGSFQSFNSSAEKPATMSVCYNVGNVISTSSNGSVASVSGKHEDYTHVDVIYYKDDTNIRGIGEAKNLTGVAAAKSEDFMKSDDLVMMLNNGAYTYNQKNPDAIQLCAWKAVAGGYPIFDMDKAPEFTEIKDDLIYDEVNDVYEIPTAKALRDFAEKVHTVDNTIKGKLTTDIDLEGEEFTPIGNLDTRFAGSFDGAGYSISGLYINSDSDYQGLFGYISAATIANVSVSGSVTGGEYVGGLVGHAYKSSVTSCNNSATVYGTGSCIGGVIGYSDGSPIASCSNSGTVTAEGANAIAGGVIGQGQGSSNSISECSNSGAITSKKGYAGGIIGEASWIPITACHNGGRVASESYTAGGITGLSQRSTITACYNIGVVSSEKEHAGGLVGDAWGGIIAACYNRGDLSGGASTKGGILGYASDGSKVYAVYSTADVAPDASNTTLAGVVKYASYSYGNTSSYSTFGDTYFKNEFTYATVSGITAQYYHGVLPVGMSAQDMKASTFVDTLNAAVETYNTANPDATLPCKWKSGDDGYPVFDFVSMP